MEEEEALAEENAAMEEAEIAHHAAIDAELEAAAGMPAEVDDSDAEIDEDYVDSEEFDITSDDEASESENELPSLPLNLTSSYFYGGVIDPEKNEVIGDKPWMIDFFAPWCPHCQHLAPTWDELHQKHEEELNVAKVDCT